MSHLEQLGGLDSQPCQEHVCDCRGSFPLPQYPPPTHTHSMQNAGRLGSGLQGPRAPSLDRLI